MAMSGNWLDWFALVFSVVVLMVNCVILGITIGNQRR